MKRQRLVINSVTLGFAYMVPFPRKSQLPLPSHEGQHRSPNYEECPSQFWKKRGDLGRQVSEDNEHEQLWVQQGNLGPKHRGIDCHRLREVGKGCL